MISSLMAKHLLPFLYALDDSGDGLNGLVDIVDNSLVDTVGGRLPFVAHHLEGTVGSFLPNDSTDGRRAKLDGNNILLNAHNDSFVEAFGVERLHAAELVFESGCVAQDDSVVTHAWGELDITCFGDINLLYAAVPERVAAEG